MHLVLHQLKTDLRQFRLGLMTLWGLFALHAALFSCGLPDVSHLVARVSLLFVEGLLATLLVARCIQADAQVGTSAFWMARPLMRRDLFWSKTAFILLCLFLPLLASQTIQWSAAGLSVGQGFLAALETLVWGLGFLFLAATLAALTPNLTHFLAAAGLAGFSFVASALLTNYASDAGLLPARRWTPLATVAPFLAALTFVFVCIALAWLLQARTGRWRASVATLTAGLVLSTAVHHAWRYDFLSVPSPVNRTVAVSLSPDDDLTETASAGQILCANFRVTGLGTNQVAVVHTLHGDFQPERGPALVFHEFKAPYLFESDPMRSRQQPAYLDAIQTCYPADTLWFFDHPIQRHDVLSVQGEVPPQYFSKPPRGELRATIALDIFEPVQLADLPLAPGSFTLTPGEKLTVRKVKADAQGIAFDLQLSVVNLLFRRSARTNLLGRAWSRRPPVTFVLHHPGLGEAYSFPLERSPWVLPLGFNSQLLYRGSHRAPYPALRGRLTGVPTDRWLRDARLQVYQARYDSSARRELHATNHTLRLSSEAADRHAAAEADQVFRQASLPANPSEAEIEAYLDAVLDHLPERFGTAEFETLRQKLTAIGARGLPQLLDRWPLARPADAAARYAIRELATREHLPALRAALRRDPELVTLFTQKQWEADARDILLEQLRDHRRPLPGAALVVAASAKDPATYADLAWHFTRLQSGHDQVLAALARCPGFDAAPAIREAWKRVRLGLGSQRDLALPAAAEGLPGALLSAILQLESHNNPTTVEQIRTRLAELTGSTQQGPGLQDWLIENALRFRFDPDTRRYTLTDG